MFRPDPFCWPLADRGEVRRFSGEQADSADAREDEDDSRGGQVHRVEWVSPTPGRRRTFVRYIGFPLMNNDKV